MKDAPQQTAQVLGMAAGLIALALGVRQRRKQQRPPRTARRSRSLVQLFGEAAAPVLFGLTLLPGWQVSIV
jgi:hypothetical protein